MKHNLAHKKSLNLNSLPSPRFKSADQNGNAFVPPAYGIDFLDRGSVQATAGSPPNGRSALQREVHPSANREDSGARSVNRTGLPDALKSGIEGLSGLSMENVRVHFNSSRPAQLQAFAYTQGTQIHVAPGQERHLPHEAWHVVQQKQNRVKPSLRTNTGFSINDDPGLENEAEVVGAKAIQFAYNHPKENAQSKFREGINSYSSTNQIMARRGIAYNGPQGKEPVRANQNIDQNNPIFNPQNAFHHKPVVQRALATFEELSQGIQTDIRGRTSLTVPQEIDARYADPTTGLLAKTIADVDNLYRIDDSTTGAVSPYNLHEKNTDMQTNIAWTQENVNTDGTNLVEGKTMRARPLGPDHKKGSEPDNSKNDAHWVRRRKALDQVGGRNKYKAGHLLNADLGGPGNQASNLTAFSTKTNSEHTRIEQPVKNQVNKDGNWGYYDVTMSFDNDTGPSALSKFPHGLEYASRLQAEWVPLGLQVRPATLLDNTPIEVFTPSSTGFPVLFPIANEKLTLDIRMPSPSSVGGGTDTGDTPLDIAGGVADPNLRIIRTDIEPGDIVLDTDVSIIVRSVSQKIARLLQKTEQLSVRYGDSKTVLSDARDDIEMLEHQMLGVQIDQEEAAEASEIQWKTIDRLRDEKYRLFDEIDRLRRERSRERKYRRRAEGEASYYRHDRNREKERRYKAEDDADYYRRDRSKERSRRYQAEDDAFYYRQERDDAESEIRRLKDALLGKYGNQRSSRGEFDVDDRSSRSSYSSKFRRRRSRSRSRSRSPHSKRKY
jgi:hypothetical protein